MSAAIVKGGSKLVKELLRRKKYYDRQANMNLVERGIARKLSRDPIYAASPAGKRSKEILRKMVKDRHIKVKKSKNIQKGLQKRGLLD